ncbi:hypothetical protein QNH46_06875 [Paenibacillus woosongensis]|uniref:Uncharacterized protein n=1 Tax=Paenibacillus woosongensis TaxID=307580 RepID=A0A7X2YZQ1_9BACL|nr:hypothetical protein [Paenibacillus woosongensis]MUG44089.1 hypothetical protein [Paenibacillus woosongensis]WHX50377.1 hypothetical protein QNH46_06875 [Paenibacillus woosongensis]
MGTFLDARTSVNSNRPGFPGTPLSSSPELFGIIGLQTQNVPNPIVILHGSIGILGDIGDVVTIEIVRGATYAPQNVIYRIENVVSESTDTQLTNFVAADINAPAAPETIYSSYVSGISTSVRNGPESFVGMASTP